MAADNVIERAIEEIADGLPINWSAIESGIQNDEQREYLECLRVLGGIADVHRSTDAEQASNEETVARGDPGPEGASAEGAGQWGRYPLLQKVGEGAFGSVYRAWDPQLEREIAIKILHQHISDSKLKERLLHEGRALAKVRHANVVNVLGVESYQDRVGLCMEFVRGETLATELSARGTLGAREAALVGQDVCRALAAVHSAGFVHRDVKARNVMREQGGRIVLMDFGTGRETEGPRGGSFDMAGTPVYMAPEVLAGGRASPTSDVYSVGVLMYHLVTGDYPAMGRTMDELREAHKQGRRKLLSERRPDLPLRFMQVVESALATRPEERCPSAGALLDALAAFEGRKRSLIDRTIRHLITGAIFVAVTVSVLVSVGLLTSIAFNTALGRSEFAGESFGDWFKAGWMSAVKPTFDVMVGFLAMGLVAVIHRLLLASSARARRLDEALRLRLAGAAARWHLDDPSVASSWMLLVSAALLAGAWWYFSPLIGAVGSTRISTARSEDLTILSPAFYAYHDQYREVFSYLTIALAVAWYYAATRIRRTNGSLKNGVLVGGLVVVLLSLASLDFPYRLLVQPKFTAARWSGNDCYIIGERPNDLLLFCPTLAPPRNRIVQRNSQSLERFGTENIFSRFAQEQTR
jgi:hypothetical protein